MPPPVSGPPAKPSDPTVNHPWPSPPPGTADGPSLPPSPGAERVVPDEALSPFVGPPLRLGNRGDSVRAVQEQLRHLGRRVRVDGVFGPETRDAVIDFQRAKHLVPDGVVGPHTWEALGI